MIVSLGRFILAVVAVFFGIGLMLITVGGGNFDKDTVESFAAPFFFVGTLAFAVVLLGEVLS
jgi:hypothetical protein